MRMLPQFAPQSRFGQEEFIREITHHIRPLRGQRLDEPLRQLGEVPAIGLA